MDTKHEAQEVADRIEQHGGATAYQAADLLRSQHARIEELEREIQALLDGTQHCGEMQYVGPDELSPWERARALLTKKD